MFWKKSARAVALRVSEEKGLIGDKLSFAASEAYKLLRTNVEFSIPDEKKCRIIGITSGLRGEGKTTTAINLSYSLAQSGKCVLLLVADMRLPTISKRVGLTRTPGLSNLLAGLCTGAEVLQKSKLLPNFYVTTSGDIPPNPSELLGSEQMAISVKALAQNFDFIILDLPPVNVVSDALVVSKLIHGMIVVVRQGSSSRQSVAETMRHLKFLEAKVLGFVLVGADEQHNRYKRYSKKYGYGYGDEDRDAYANASKRAERPETAQRSGGKATAGEK